MMNRIVRDDRILPETRVVSALIVPFLIAGFVILYLFPDDTGRLFAWTIEPSMTLLVMGAGYVAGAYFLARAVFASRWHEVGLGFLPTAMFTYPMALATFFHWDKSTTTTSLFRSGRCCTSSRRSSCRSCGSETDPQIPRRQAGATSSFPGRCAG